MKINIDAAKKIQWLLVDDLLNGEGLFSPLSSVSHDDEDDWQFMVEMIYRLLVSGLTELFPDDILILSFNGIEDYCKELAKQSPFEDSVWNEPMAWGGPTFGLTQKCKLIIDQYFDGKYWHTQDFILNIPFIECIEDIFAECGVPWCEEEPLFPIAK